LDVAGGRGPREGPVRPAGPKPAAAKAQGGSLRTQAREGLGPGAWPREKKAGAWILRLPPGAAGTAGFGPAADRPPAGTWGPGSTRTPVPPGHVSRTPVQGAAGAPGPGGREPREGRGGGREPRVPERHRFPWPRARALAGLYEERSPGESVPGCSRGQGSQGRARPPGGTEAGRGQSPRGEPQDTGPGRLAGAAERKRREQARPQRTPAQRGCPRTPGKARAQLLRQGEGGVKRAGRRASPMPGVTHALAS
jgi:hypothetical protein